MKWWSQLVVEVRSRLLGFASGFVSVMVRLARRRLLLRKSPAPMASHDVPFERDRRISMGLALSFSRFVGHRSRFGSDSIDVTEFVLQFLCFWRSQLVTQTNYPHGKEENSLNRNASTLRRRNGRDLREPPAQRRRSTQSTVRAPRGLRLRCMANTKASSHAPRSASCLAHSTICCTPMV